MQAKDFMTRDVVTVDADAPLSHCMDLLTRHQISGLPVVEGGRAVGIITEADIIKHVRGQIPWYTFFADGTWLPLDFQPETVQAELSELRARPVRSVMTKRLISVRPDADLHDVARVLLDNHIKRVVVVDQGRLVGIISRGDVVHALLQAP
jgi:CBS domain-containing protein